MKLDTLLEGLHGVRHNGTGWRALCPAHADQNPSLSVDLREGKILVHCHAGCSQQAVLAALGIKEHELFTGEGEARRIKDVYDYRDENGKLLYQVIRYEPKDFRQRRPDGHGGWIWDLKGTWRVLYRLPELLAAKEVLIVEGEKDVETARAIGFTSTTCGAAGKWRDEFSEFLRGKRVFIIADADDPGRKHAQQVARSLYGKAQTIKVFELPGAKDLSEWIGKGFTSKILSALIEDTPAWESPMGEPQNGFQLTPLRNLILEPEESISWLLADKLPAGGLSVLSAKPKVGKSTFARRLALAVAKGEPFLGCTTTKGPVIYLALEELRSEVRRHFVDLGATGEEDICIHVASAPQEALLKLCALTKELKPVLIVIDPLFKFIKVRDEKAYAELCSAIEPLLTLARESGTHLLLTHHNGKAARPDATDSILGSTAIFGAVDSAIILKKSHGYRTVQSSQRYGTDWAESVLNFDPNERSLSLGGEKSEAHSERIGGSIVSYLAGCKEPQTRLQIEDSVQGKTNHKRAALTALCTAGKVSKSGPGTKGDPFLYALIPGAKLSTDSGARVNAGTREQESQYQAETTINTGDILVPESSVISEDGTTSWVQEFLEGEL